MKVYIVKYALSRGIFEAWGDEVVMGSSVYFRGNNPERLWLGKGQYSTDPQEAVRLAESMREKKIRSVRKQLDRLMVGSFTLDKPAEACQG